MIKCDITYETFYDIRDYLVHLERTLGFTNTEICNIIDRYNKPYINIISNEEAEKFKTYYKNKR